jgi:hypothetical protein
MTPATANTAAPPAVEHPPQAPRAAKAAPAALAVDAERQAGPVLDTPPPQDLLAEQAALGAMLLDGTAAATCARLLRPEDFADPAHRTLFDFLASHREPGETPDLVTVTASLRVAGLLETVGGQGYVADLADSCPITRNAPEYCHIIRHAAAQREAVQAGLELARRAGQRKADVPELVKALNVRMRRVVEPGGAEAEADESRPVLTCLADVKAERLRWLWPARIPLGKVSLLFGDPGLGKTFATLDIAARVSRGMPWPDAPGERLAAGGVILLSAEDDVADTIRPRLDAAGADVRRIVALQGVEYARGGKGYFNLACDLPALEAAIRQTPETRLVILDPVSAYLGGTDSHKNAEIRGLLAPLADLAARHDVAVLTITHMSKGIAGRALYRAMGSLGFIAAARAAWLAIADADNPHRRLFLPAKMNLAEEPSGLAYALQSVMLDGIGPVGRVAWESGPVTLTADAALAAAAADPEARGARDVAADWLKEALAAGPMTADDLKAAAKASGVAWRTVRRAQVAVGVKVRRQGFGPDGKWYWLLPGQVIDGQHKELDAYGQNDALEGEKIP